MTSSIDRGKAATLLLVLTLLNVLNFADRYLILAFSNVIIPELGLSNFQFGLLNGVGFTAVYTIVGLFAGSLADRYDRSTVIGFGLMLWSAVTTATGFAHNFLQMTLARMLIGVGEASLTPAAVAMLADAFPPARRALVSGVYYLGVPIGIGGSFLFAAAVGPSMGWRGAFMVLGMLGLAASAAVLLFLFDPPRVTGRPGLRQAHKTGEKLTANRKAELREWVQHSITGQPEPPPRRLADTLGALVRELRGNPAFRWALIGATAFSFVGAGGVLDLVWWINERGYDEAAARKITGAMFLFGGTLGALFGGLGADWAYRKTPAGRLKFLAWISVVSVPLIVAYRLVPGHTPAFIALAVCGAILSMLMFGPLFSVVQELVAPAHRAAAVALFLLCGALLGIGGGNATVGFLADFFGARGYAAPITYATLCMVLGCIISIPAFFIAARHHAAQLLKGSPDAAPGE